LFVKFYIRFSNKIYKWNNWLWISITWPNQC